MIWTMKICICLSIQTSTVRYNPIEGSQIKITRIAYKNNQSKYTVNDRNSSFSEVTEILKKRGIDLNNNRFLILQGEVEQISLMKPKV